MSPSGIESLDWALVDTTYVEYLQSHPDMPERWLLVQTLSTASSRRAVLGVLGVQPRCAVLDVGTGFGPTLLELAGMVPIDGLGLDQDPRILASARDLGERLGTKGWFQQGSTLGFVRGNAYAIPSDTATFDLAITRFVLQHLDDPAQACEELYRVVKPGGTVCIVDADDGLSLTYPEPSAAFTRLRHAFREVQRVNGGDREVGRKLSSYLARAGFEITSVLVLPQATHAHSLPSDIERAYALDRFGGKRDEIIAHGILSAQEMDECLALFAQEHAEDQCNIEAHLAVVARRPQAR